MKKLIAVLLMLLSGTFHSFGQVENIFQVRGFCIGSPKAWEVDRFVKFIHEELATRKVNTLILRVGYNYQYESYPQLRDSAALSKADVRKIVDACAKDHIRIIPQANLLGHQSSRNKLGSLLKNFPEFDETPQIQMPEKYVWPNDDGLYCKSYCPLHPDVHKVVFAVVDELCEVFHADAFHAGMDEVFYLGSDKCPRCSGVDKADLFGNEVRLIRSHLAQKNRELWIWGDRLIDGKTSGMGIWEASFNNTARAVDLIPKDIVICDWHYERPDQTAVYFALKGFRVVTCPWRRPAVSTAQTEDMARFRQFATKEMKDRYYGMVQTVWSGTEPFLDGFYGIQSEAAMKTVSAENKDFSAWNAFRTMFTKMDELNRNSH